jgi:uncharacterized protein (TIGR04255 family)
MENIRNCDAEMESMILMSEVANSLGLPTFEAPPISEVVFGILFKPLDKLLTPHLGVFWQEIKNSYPIIQEAPMLAPAIEPKGPQVPNQTISTDLFHSTFPRVWFLEENGNSLMQLQRDRFLHNWRKISESQIYPRYGSIKQIFEERFSHFSNFITKNSLGSITPLQFELTYVNTIDSKSGWTGPESIGSILNDFSWNSKDRFLPIPEAIHWRTALPLPDNSRWKRPSSNYGINCSRNIAE